MNWYSLEGMVPEFGGTISVSRDRIYAPSRSSHDGVVLDVCRKWRESPTSSLPMETKL